MLRAPGLSWISHTQAFYGVLWARNGHFGGRRGRNGLRVGRCGLKFADCESAGVWFPAMRVPIGARQRSERRERGFLSVRCIASGGVESTPQIEIRHLELDLIR